MNRFRTCRPWAMAVAGIFLLGMMFASVNPASAARGVEKGSESGAPGGAPGTLSGGQGSGIGNPADPQGPPDNPGPGCYKKIPGKGDKEIYQYFKNGHPENPSEWEYVGPSCEPYGQ